MSEHWFDFLKTGRFDRFDTLYEVEQDRAGPLLEGLGETARSLAVGEEVDAKYNSRCLGATPNGGKRLYSFETWGQMAAVMAKYADEREWAHLQRLDYRIETDIDADKLLGFYAYAMEHRQKGRNVQSFDSRQREKKEGRHAGGKGVCIGSHKSDVRLVVYKRKGEVGAIELQLSGKKLRQMVGAGMEQWRGAPDKWVLAQVMADMCQAALEKMARETGFESALALVRSVSPDAPQEPPPDFVAEQPVQNLLQCYMDLAPEEKDRALQQMMAERLGMPSL